MTITEARVALDLAVDGLAEKSYSIEFEFWSHRGGKRTEATWKVWLSSEQDAYHGDTLEIAVAGAIHAIKPSQNLPLAEVSLAEVCK